MHVVLLQPAQLTPASGRSWQLFTAQKILRGVSRGHTGDGYSPDLQGVSHQGYQECSLCQ